MHTHLYARITVNSNEDEQINSDRYICICTHTSTYNHTSTVDLKRHAKHAQLPMATSSRCKWQPVRSWSSLSFAPANMYSGPH